MRITRIYEPQPLHTGAVLELAAQNAAHLCRVLRLSVGAPLQVFDGQGHEYAAVLSAAGKKAAVTLGGMIADNRESPLYTILGQVISRGDKMDFTIQKAVELGISAVYPLSSVRCGVKLAADRLERKVSSWQKIAASACEQCGRSVVPTVHPVMDLSAFCTLMSGSGALCLTLDPYAGRRFADFIKPDKLCLLIGPEGGFDAQETASAAAAGFQGVRLGPRILRTETAALTALSIAGILFGDL